MSMCSSEVGSILKVTFVLSKWPHFRIDYFVTARKLMSIAVDNQILKTVLLIIDKKYIVFRMDLLKTISEPSH